MTSFVALLVLAAIAAAASASGGATVTRQDVTGETVSCDNGILTVTAGSFQIVVQETQTASGAYHLIVEGNAQGVQATGPGGAMYLIPGGFWMELNVTPGATTSTETDVLNVIGQGGAPNFSARAVVHTRGRERQRDRVRGSLHGNGQLCGLTSQRTRPDRRR